MIREVAIVLFALTGIFAQVPYPYGYKSPPGVIRTPSPAPYAVPVPVPYAPSPIPVPAPVPVPQIRSGVAERDAHIVSEAREVNFDGSFNYGFDSENGISVKSKGYVKPAPVANEEPIQVIEGSYSYIDTFGKPNTIQYIADENGYRAFGDGIPQPSEAILKSLPVVNR